MTAYMTRYCDECGETVVLSAFSGEPLADKDLRVEGWRLGDDEDFCPECAKQVKEKDERL